jgi:hypothetical protein
MGNGFSACEAALRPASYSVADLARRWKIGGDKIRAFIRRGELVAVNVAATMASRPQWRITPESLRAFEERRTSAGPPPRARRRRRIATVDYYPEEEG